MTCGVKGHRKCNELFRDALDGLHPTPVFSAVHVQQEIVRFAKESIPPEIFS
jgi:hypothetical protein